MTGRVFRIFRIARRAERAASIGGAVQAGAFNFTDATNLVHLGTVMAEAPELIPVMVAFGLWLAFAPQIFGLSAGPFATAEQQREFVLKKIYGQSIGHQIYVADFNARRQEVDLRGKVP